MLAKAGAHVYLCGRTVAKANKAIADFQGNSMKGKLTAFACDLSSLQGATACGEAFAATESKLHHLILNAGVAWRPEHSLTPDGFETTMGK